MKFNIKDILLLVVLLFSHVVFAETTTNDSNASASVIELNKKEFLSKVFNYEKDMTKWAYEGDKPCMVVFYADYCPPCRKLLPTLQVLAKENQHDIIIYRINITQEKELAALFDVQSIPSILFVPMNEAPQKLMGAWPQKELQQIIDTFLLGKEEVEK